MILITLCRITSYVTGIQKDKSMWAQNTPLLHYYTWNGASDLLQCQTEANAQSENKRLSFDG